MTPPHSHHNTIELLPIGSTQITVDIEPPTPRSPDLDSAIYRRWNAHLASNPHAFDGPLLAVILIDPSASRIVARPDRYRALIASDSIEQLEIHQLGVTGVVTAHDHNGAPCLLLGRRGTHTRIYPGLWETAPAGGVEPPPAPASLDTQDLLDQLLREGDEELGLSLRAATASPLLILRDRAARSDDVVFALALPDTVDPRQTLCRSNGDREYADTAWITADDLPDFTRRNANAIAPPALALLHHLRWV